MKKIVSFFVSLKLTVTLLAFAIILVFIGTLAQADEGLYVAQGHYFKQWVVIGADLFGHNIPLLLPGGYLIGVLLLVNLVSAHIYRFQLSVKKIGIQLAHLGVIVLLVGQLTTDMLAHEMQIRFAEGETRNYSESATEYELHFVSGDTNTDIPATMLKPGAELQLPSLPFAIRVKTFWKNSNMGFRAPMVQNGPPVASNGAALHFDFVPAPEVKTTDQKNIPTAIVEFATPQGSLGTWAVSGWVSDESIAQAEQEGYTQQVGATMAAKIASQLGAPQSMEIDDKKFAFQLRPTHYRQPFTLTLLKATHTVYPGTISPSEPQGIPKDFRSRVRIDNRQSGEQREVEISMNHPLRYDGLTFYQYQMTAGDALAAAGGVPSSVLQVVRNPSWLTPYIGCAMVALGLVIQFMFHLAGFVTKQRKK